MLSFVIPVLNEAKSIEQKLILLQLWRDKGHELILVDGGSVDATVSMAGPYVDQILESQQGRAVQMNAGANVARGSTLIFLHVDTLLPDNFSNYVQQIEHSQGWGFFRVRLSGSNLLFRVIETFMNLRSRLTSIATGDQTLFVDKSLFIETKGFPEITLMEDIAICKKLKKISSPFCLNTAVVTSSRRWEEQGIVRTMLLMWLLRAMFFLGFSPQILAGFYYRNE